MLYHALNLYWSFVSLAIMSCMAYSHHDVDDDGLSEPMMREKIIFIAANVEPDYGLITLKSVSLVAQ